MKRILSFLAGACVYLIGVFLLSGYGNKTAHIGINTAIVDGFASRYINTSSPLPKFKNYLFVLDGSVGMPGEAIVASGFELVNTDQKKYNAKLWMIHGGYSADEPELPASFRHFYDPTEPEGERYLHNHLDYLEEKLDPLFFNPRVDHIEWAITHPDHEYNWMNGIKHVKMALEEPNPDTRDEHMAFAYRALGETLHLLGDMGCPAHVRDDSHPAPFGRKGVAGFFGSPDPYEEVFESFKYINEDFSKGEPDVDLKSKFRKAVRIEDIARELAWYTNQNFFTEQTIQGTGVIPRIHPEKTYPLPSLNSCEYDPETYSFSKTISGEEVILCKDKRFAIGSFALRGYPYIDEECVASQGMVLIPQIIEAGANAIRLFIPELKVKVEKYDQQVLSGKVIHTTDQEHGFEIRYNGIVEILNARGFKSLGKVQAVNGSFQGTIDLSKMDFDLQSDQLVAQIEFGDIYVNSEPFSVKGTGLVFGMTIKDFNADLIIEDTASLCRNYQFLITVPPNTPSNYRIRLVAHQDEWGTMEFGATQQPEYLVDFKKRGDYVVSCTLLDASSKEIDKITRKLTVKGNNMIPILHNYGNCFARLGADEQNDEFVFEDGKVRGEWFSFHKLSTYDSPDSKIVWDGPSFTFEQKGYSHLLIQGTLADNGWIIKSLKASFVNKLREMHLELANVPVFNTPCTFDGLTWITFSVSTGLCQPYVVSAYGRDRRLETVPWVNFVSNNWQKLHINVTFMK
jgi:hypothetical protein